MFGSNAVTQELGGSSVESVEGEDCDFNKLRIAHRTMWRTVSLLRLRKVCFSVSAVGWPYNLGTGAAMFGFVVRLDPTGRITSHLSRGRKKICESIKSRFTSVDLVIIDFVDIWHILPPRTRYRLLEHGHQEACFESWTANMSAGGKNEASKYND